MYLALSIIILSHPNTYFLTTISVQGPGILHLKFSVQLQGVSTHSYTNILVEDIDGAETICTCTCTSDHKQDEENLSEDDDYLSLSLSLSLSLCFSLPIATLYLHLHVYCHTTRTYSPCISSSAPQFHAV